MLISLLLTSTLLGGNGGLSPSVLEAKGESSPATPITDYLATPIASDVQQREIASVEIGAALKGATQLAVAQIVIPPGVSVRDVSTEGPRILVLQYGQVQLIAGADAGFLPSDSQPPTDVTSPETPATGTEQIIEPVVAGTRVTLTAGDRFTQTIGSIIEMWNTGERSVVLLDIALLPQDHLVSPFTHGDGWSVEPIILAPIDLPNTAHQLTIGEWALPQGATIVTSAHVTCIVGRVQGGSLTVAPLSGTAQYAEPARLAPGSVGGGLEPLIEGSSVRLGAGGVVVSAQSAVVRMLAETPTRVLFVAVW